MKVPGLNYLKDKWVLGGLLLGAGVYYFTQHHAAAPHPAMIHHHFKKKKHHGGGGGGFAIGRDRSSRFFPHYDSPGQYELGGPEMRFSGQAELQRRLTIS